MRSSIAFGASKKCWKQRKRYMDEERERKNQVQKQLKIVTFCEMHGSRSASALFSYLIGGGGGVFARFSVPKAANDYAITLNAWLWSWISVKWGEHISTAACICLPRRHSRKIINLATSNAYSIKLKFTFSVNNQQWRATEGGINQEGIPVRSSSYRRRR